MTATSLLPKSAAAAGIGFDELVARILADARLDVSPRCPIVEAPGEKLLSPGLRRPPGGLSPRAAPPQAPRGGSARRRRAGARRGDRPRRRGLGCAGARLGARAPVLAAAVPHRDHAGQRQPDAHERRRCSRPRACARERAWSVSTSAAARARLVAHPRVREASLRRRLPGTIVVEIAERVPCVIVRADRDYLVDAEGAIVAEAAPGTRSGPAGAHGDRGGGRRAHRARRRGSCGRDRAGRRDPPGGLPGALGHRSRRSCGPGRCRDRPGFRPPAGPRGPAGRGRAVAPLAPRGARHGAALAGAGVRRSARRGPGGGAAGGRRRRPWAPKGSRGRARRRTRPQGQGTGAGTGRVKAGGGHA